MRKGWKRVAERCDQNAFASEEVSEAIVVALEQDCRQEMSAPFLDAAWRIFADPEPSLFTGQQIAPQLESLRQMAGSGLGRMVLEEAILVAERGGTGMAGLTQAITNALTNRAAKGARQIEEHYCRESTTPRARHVRARIEEVIGSAAFDGLAHRILRVESTPRPQITRQQGLDDGVRF